MQIWENEHVGFSHGLSIFFVRQRGRRGVDLQFAVDFHGDAEFDGFFAASSVAAFICDGGVLARDALTGVAGARLGCRWSGGLSVAVVTAMSQSCSLVGSGTTVQSARKSSRSFPRVEVLEVEDVERRDGGHGLASRDDLSRGAGRWRQNGGSETIASACEVASMSVAK